jgi:circadian clock protein KaiB
MSEAPSSAEAGPRARVQLYVAGDAPNSVAAIANLIAALARHPAHDIKFEIIDVLVDPERGLADNVLVTPMLVRMEPLPERRILGTLRDASLLLAVLGLPAGDG